MSLEIIDFLRTRIDTEFTEQLLRTFFIEELERQKELSVLKHKHQLRTMDKIIRENELKLEQVIETIFLYLNLKFILSCCAIASSHHFQLVYTQ